VCVRACVCVCVRAFVRVHVLLALIRGVCARAPVRMCMCACPACVLLCALRTGSYRGPRLSPTVDDVWQRNLSCSALSLWQRFLSVAALALLAALTLCGSADSL
jgi:hypothetical protein